MFQPILSSEVTLYSSTQGLQEKFSKAEQYFFGASGTCQDFSQN